MGPHVVATYSTAVDATSLREHVKAFTAAATLADRADAFIALVRWTRHDAASDARLDALLDLLEEPDEGHRFHDAISTLLVEAESTNAFAHTGIPSERGFLAALGERIMDRVLPRPRNDQDLGDLLPRNMRRLSPVRRSTLRKGRLSGRARGGASCLDKRRLEGLPRRQVGKAMAPLAGKKKKGKFTARTYE